MTRMNSMRTGACVAVIAAAGCGVTQAAVPEGRSAAPAERTAESTERRSTDVTAFVRALQDSHGGDGGDRMLLSVEQIAERSDRVVLGRIVSVKRGADVQTSIPDYLRGTGTVPWVIAVIDAEVVVERSAGADESLVTDVYAQVTPQLREQLAEVLALEGRRVNEGGPGWNGRVPGRYRSGWPAARPGIRDGAHSG